MSDVQENSGDKSLQAVTVDSVNPDGMQFSDFSTASSKVILLLSYDCKGFTFSEGAAEHNLLLFSKAL